MSNFENQVQQWVLLDNQLKKINEQVKELREKRNAVCDNIINYAIENNITNSALLINDGKLKFVNTRVPEPLTFKYLEKTLSEVIKNESQIKIIIEQLKQKRAIKLVPELKRFYNN